LFVKYGPSRPSKLLAIEKCSHRRYPMSQLFLAFSRDKAFMPSTQSTLPLREQGPSKLQSSGTAEPKPCNARYQSLFGTVSLPNFPCFCLKRAQNVSFQLNLSPTHSDEV
jgi:hypothetical protein